MTENLCLRPRGSGLEGVKVENVGRRSWKFFSGIFKLRRGRPSCCKLYLKGRSKLFLRKSVQVIFQHHLTFNAYGKCFSNTFRILGNSSSDTNRNILPSGMISISENENISQKTLNFDGLTRVKENSSGWMSFPMARLNLGARKRSDKLNVIRELIEVDRHVNSETVLRNASSLFDSAMEQKAVSFHRAAKKVASL